MGYLYVFSIVAFCVTLVFAIVVDSLRLRAAALIVMFVAMGFIVAYPID